MGKQKEIMYLVALSLQRKKFLETMQLYDKKTVEIGDEQSDFISHLVLNGSFDDKVLHYVFALPYKLIDQVRNVYLH